MQNLSSCFKYLLIIVTLSAFECRGQQRKAVFIIVDGVPADVLEKAEAPVINSIRSEGSYTRGYLGGEAGSYSQSPTVSAVGYNHVLTGVWSNKHNVFDNDIEAPNYHYWNIFRILKTMKPDAKTAIFSTWTDNRTKLVGDGLPQAGSFRFDHAADGFETDTVQYPHDRERLFIFNIDEKVSTEAGRYIREEGPDLSWVYLEYTDDMGHTFGDGPRLMDAVKKADTQVGRVWDAVKERQAKHGEEWMIIVTTDHGRDAKTGKDHGGQSERERTIWMVTNVKETNAHFKETPATVDIMPSILRFMNVEMPAAVRDETDGVPFIGPVSISDMKATLRGKNIEITWRALDRSGKVEVKVATTNNFQKGGTDLYQTLATVDVASEKATIEVSKMRSSFYKILLSAPHNTMNRWIITK